MVDLEAANERGVKIANVPGYATEAVAEHAIALMLAVVRAIPQGDVAMRANRSRSTPAIVNTKGFSALTFEARRLESLGWVRSVLGSRNLAWGSG
jgi:lactate dehydrogenase-like 2-hydroxyacid dehydrogenase